MTTPLLEVEGLRVHLGDPACPVRAVEGVDFTLQRGEIFVLLGESGCGKSMTALSLLRLLPPSGRFVAGSIRLDGQDLLQLPEHAMRAVRGRRIAMIFQEPQTALNPVMTVGAQIDEVLHCHRQLRGAMALRRAVELLDDVGIPDPERRYGEYPHQLSGGMKQRVLIAMALAGEPDLLIADEPTTALDVTIQAQVLEVLRRLKQKTGMAILLITHDLGVVAEMADRVAVMYAGHIVEQADRATFFRSPAHPYTRRLFDSVPNLDKRAASLAVIAGTVPPLTQVFKGCRFESRCELRRDVCAQEVPQWWVGEGTQLVRCHLFNPASTADKFSRRAAPRMPAEAMIETSPDQTPLLTVRDLKVHFPIQRGLFRRTVGQVYAVDGVSLDIAPGRTLALVGESGCGKTTAGKAIVQLLPLTAGRVRFRGQELTEVEARRLRRLRSDIQFIFQDPYSAMNPRMMVGDIVAEGMVAQNIGASRQERMQRVDELLQQVGLTPEIKSRYPHEFSGGQRQRICIARALAVNPQLIICDEPTSALDVSVQAQILNLLKELQDRRGLSYLFITHNLAVVEYLAHHVAVMYLGRIVEHGSVEDVLKRPQHPYTRALLSAVPQIDPRSRREIIRLPGELPSPSAPPRGCHFHPRCPQALPKCQEAYPRAVAVSDTHIVRCVLYDGPAPA
jgi:peptide/nickel transport system ATP-binding protein